MESLLEYLTTRTGIKMSTPLEQIANSAVFQIDVFDGLLKLEGRILTPAETESVGLSSSLLASELMASSSGSSGGSILNLQKEIEGKDFSELEESQVQRLLDYAKSIKPESLIRISEKEDHLLCKIIRRGSQDKGKTWEKLKLVTAIDQQDAKNGTLWVGVLPKEDRQKILDAAMISKKEAGARLRTFRK